MREKTRIAVNVYHTTSFLRARLFATAFSVRMVLKLGNDSHQKIIFRSLASSPENIKKRLQRTGARGENQLFEIQQLTMVVNEKVTQYTNEAEDVSL